jgi:hypothetical protein
MCLYSLQPGPLLTLEALHGQCSGSDTGSPSLVQEDFVSASTIHGSGTLVVSAMEAGPAISETDRHRPDLAVWRPSAGYSA